ncbi:hypothetical protein GGR57DRAFT_98633 [Xylariaceae sp. FL1272]|nr:hypothetical protein GGR57DRAFT_98633 [Xylariaceae sp. FL1272]
MALDMARWKKRVHKLSIGSVSIHDGKRTEFSGSTIKEYHFLLLRVLWTPTGSAESLYKKSDSWISREYLERSSNLLNSGVIRHAWTNYLESVPMSKERLTKDAFNGLSTFSLVRYHQLQSIESSTGEKQRVPPESSPVAGRTRSKGKAAQPSSPTRPSGRPVTPNIVAGVGALSIEDSPGSTKDASSVESGSETGSLYLDPYQLKAIEDEQIVNTALILFLNALTIHFPDLTADWTLHRLAFLCRNGNGEKTYEARVDGFLRRQRDNEPLVILEVKPFRRDGERKRIIMQESAQIAAWINERPPASIPCTCEKSNQSKQSNTKQSEQKCECKCKRLIISQDRDEIYLTFGEFDQSYVNYITHNKCTGCGKWGHKEPECLERGDKQQRQVSKSDIKEPEPESHPSHLIDAWIRPL